MGFNANEFFTNLETGTSEEEHSQESEQQEFAEESQASEEEHSEIEEESTEEEESSQSEEGAEEVEGEEEKESPRKYAGRYDSVEQLEKGYKNLQAKMTRLLQEMRPKNAAQASQQEQTVPAQPLSTGIPLELATHPKFIELLRTNPLQAGAVVAEYNARMMNRIPAQAPVQQAQRDEETAAIRTKLEVLELKTRYADFDEIAVDIPAVLEGNPWLWQSPAPIENAYKLVKASRVDEALSTAAAAGKQSAERKKAEKRSATMERQQAKKQQKQKSPEEAIAEDILGAGGKKNAFIV